MAYSTLKTQKGAPYNDGTSGANKNDDFVEPGAIHTYSWPVPERAVPGPNDGNSIMWMYHSHVDEPTDTNAGLIGPMIICSRGQMRDNGLPRGIDREFVTMFTVFDENTSHYLDYNIQTCTGDPASVGPEDDGLIERNLMHSINGYVYGNLPGLTMKKGKKRPLVPHGYRS